LQSGAAAPRSSMRIHGSTCARPELVREPSLLSSTTSKPKARGQLQRQQSMCDLRVAPSKEDQGLTPGYGPRHASGSVAARGMPGGYFRAKRHMFERFGIPARVADSLRTRGAQVGAIPFQDPTSSKILKECPFLFTKAASSSRRQAQLPATSTRDEGESASFKACARRASGAIFEGRTLRRAPASASRSAHRGARGACA